MTDGSLDFGQGNDVFHQLCHFGACEIFDLRGKALNRAAQIAKAVEMCIRDSILAVYCAGAVLSVIPYAAFVRFDVKKAFARCV